MRRVYLNFGAHGPSPRYVVEAADEFVRSHEIDVDDSEATVDRLASEGIVVRALPTPDAVRASVHAVSARTEVDRLLDALESEWT